MMVYGRTPFQHITNHIIKLQCIMDPSHVIEFPEIKDKNLLDVMKVCWLICYDLKNQTCTCQYLQPQNNSPRLWMSKERPLFSVSQRAEARTSDARGGGLRMEKKKQKTPAQLSPVWLLAFPCIFRAVSSGIPRSAIPSLSCWLTLT